MTITSVNNPMLVSPSSPVPTTAAPTSASPRRSEPRKNGPRVLFLNRSYWPDVEATGQLLTELCETLAARFQVMVVAGQPNGNPDQIPFPSSGRLVRKGVEILRVCHFRFPKRNLFGRLANLVSYQLMATVRALALPKPDVIVAETDPPLVCLLGLLLRKRYGCRLVLYLQDIYPDVAVAVGKLGEGRIAGWLGRILYAAYRRADLVVVLSQDMHKRMLQIGVSPDRLACVPNWSDTTRVRPVKHHNPFRIRHGLEGRFVVMYSGNIGLTQRLESVLEAARRLRDRTDICFLIVGGGASRGHLVRHAHRLGLSNVHFHAYQPKDQLADSLSAANVHLVPLDPRLVSCLMPSKLYGILATGTPVVAMAPDQSELAQVVTQHGVGMVVPPHDPDRLADALRWCAAHPRSLVGMGAAARRLAIRRYDRENSTTAFGRLLDGVLRRSTARGHRAAGPVRWLGWRLVRGRVE